MNRLLVYYFCFCFLFFSLLASGFVDSQDGLQYLTIARRFYYQHTFEMPPEQYPLENIYMSQTVNPDGKVYSATGLGYSLALLPAVIGEDIFLKLAGLDPISAFPLQNDWPVLLFASLTNAVFGALLTVTIFAYLQELNIKLKNALLLSFVLVVSTNLVIYAKHSFAHMMFVSFLTLGFYFLKRFAKTHSLKYLVWSGAALGMMVISYNQSYILVMPAFGLYYLFLIKPKLSWQQLNQNLIHTLFGLLGSLPFLVLYYLFNHLSLADNSSAPIAGLDIPQVSPIYVIFEGIWGLLFSPGKSMFLFSPPLLILIFFWHKLRYKKMLPEIVSFMVLLIVYIYWIGSYLGGSNFLVWHGDSSWGPRYLLPTLPFLMILVGLIFTNLSNWEKRLVFWPLIILGVGIQILGLLFPYQIRFSGLPINIFVNETQFNVSEYGNLIPRYSPVLQAAKRLNWKFKNWQLEFDRSQYQTRLRDGFGLPFAVGNEAWRESLPSSQISFTNNSTNPIKQVSLSLINHQISPTSSYSAQINLFLNNSSSPQTSLELAVNKTATIELPLDLLKQNNVLQLETSFINSPTPLLKDKQVIFLQSFEINHQTQNLSALDYPYVSPISRQLFEAKYNYWGKIEQDAWTVWHMHSGVYEQTLDFWWLRPLNYWDLPVKFFALLLAADLGGLFFCAYQVNQYLKNKDG